MKFIRIFSGISILSWVGILIYGAFQAMAWYGYIIIGGVTLYNLGIWLYYEYQMRKLSK